MGHIDSQCLKCDLSSMSRNDNSNNKERAVDVIISKMTSDYSMAIVKHSAVQKNYATNLTGLRKFHLRSDFYHQCLTFYLSITRLR